MFVFFSSPPDALKTQSQKSPFFPSRGRGPLRPQQAEGREGLDTALDEPLAPLVATKMPEFIQSCILESSSDESIR